MAKPGSTLSRFTTHRPQLYNGQLLRNGKGKTKDIHMAFVYLREAFVTVPPSDQWKAIQRFEIPRELIEATKNMYKMLIKRLTRIIDNFNKKNPAG